MGGSRFRLIHRVDYTTTTRRLHPAPSIAIETLAAAGKDRRDAMAELQKIGSKLGANCYFPNCREPLQW
jgi:hypothetical protein